MGEGEVVGTGAIQKTVKTADGGTISFSNTATGGVEVAYFDKKGNMLGQPDHVEGKIDDMEEIQDTYTRYAAGGATLDQLKDLNDEQVRASIESDRSIAVGGTNLPASKGGGLVSKLFGSKTR